MSVRDVDEYLAAIDEPKRGTVERLRNTILEIVPEAEQCISYGSSRSGGARSETLGPRRRTPSARVPR